MPNTLLISVVMSVLLLFIANVVVFIVETVSFSAVVVEGSIVGLELEMPAIGVVRIF